MNLTLIGPSGVGKGTHADRIVAKYGLLHVSTGDLFRRNLENQTALGIMARKYMNQGELVPDELTDAMMEEWLRRTDPAKGILFDGFPRTTYQAKFLDELFADMGRRLDAVIYLKVSDDAIVERLSGRLICRGCQATYHLKFKLPKRAGGCDLCGCELYQRPDDNPDMVRTRLKVFHRAVGPVLDHYQPGGRLILIDGEGAIDQVFSAIIAAAEAAQRREAPTATVQEVRDLHAAPAAPAPVAVAKDRLDMVLLGGPGSGKGTQAEKLSKELRLPHIATGDLFRENLKNETDLGKLAKTYMNRGELVPDDVTEAMVEERLSRPDTAFGFILDGFPRTLPQAEALTEMLAAAKRRLAGVLYINVSDEEIVSRLSGRLICRNCQNPYHKQFKPPAKEGVCDLCAGPLYQRDDDNPNTIRARLKTFHGQTAPLVDYYQKVGLLHEVNGEGPLAEVNQRTLASARSLAKT